MSEGTIRLNRYLAMCGAGARRKVEEFITAGRVRINGEIVDEPGRQVAPGDVVELDGRELSPVEPTYLIFNKPKGVLSAVEDSRERTVIDILPPSMDRLRLFPVGRLDRDSEGLIILTNDGMFSQELIHPRNGFTKTYEVELRRPMDEPTLIQWTKGVDAEGVFLKPLSVRRLARKARNPPHGARAWKRRAPSAAPQNRQTDAEDAARRRIYIRRPRNALALHQRGENRIAKHVRTVHQAKQKQAAPGEDVRSGIFLSALQ